MSLSLLNLTSFQFQHKIVKNDRLKIIQVIALLLKNIICLIYRAYIAITESKQKHRRITLSTTEVCY